MAENGLWSVLRAFGVEVERVSGAVAELRGRWIELRIVRGREIVARAVLFEDLALAFDPLSVLLAALRSAERAVAPAPEVVATPVREAARCARPECGHLWFAHPKARWCGEVDCECTAWVEA